MQCSEGLVVRMNILLGAYCFMITTSHAYDLNHIAKIDVPNYPGSLLRTRRDLRDVPRKFLNSILPNDASLVILLDSTVPGTTFYTDVLDFTSSLLRYYVLTKKVALLTFDPGFTTVFNGFKKDFIKCDMFENEKYFYKIIHDEITNPDYTKAFLKVKDLTSNHSSLKTLLLLTAGNDGTAVTFNLLENNMELFVVELPHPRNLTAIRTIANANYTSLSNWNDVLKDYHTNTSLGVAYTEYNGTGCLAGDRSFCNLYSGVSFCNSSCPVKNASITTTASEPLNRLQPDCQTQSCSCGNNGNCSAPYNSVNICICKPGYLGKTCQEDICSGCSVLSTGVCDYRCTVKRDDVTVNLIAIVVPCVVGGVLILTVGASVIYACIVNGASSSGRKTKKPGIGKKPVPPHPSLKPVFAPPTRPDRIRETTEEEDNLYAAYGKIPRHQNMPDWLGYIEEMVTIGHMEAAAIIKDDGSEWVCSERAFKVNPREYAVLCRLLDKRAPSYKVKFKRKEYLLIENDGEIMTMEARTGDLFVVIGRTVSFLVAVKVAKNIGLESAKNEVNWVKGTIQQQEMTLAERNY